MGAQQASGEPHASGAAPRESAVFLWADRALFIGDRSVTAVHSHHALELCMALDEQGLRVRSPGGADLEGACGVLIRPNARHQLSIPGPKVAVLYVDPFSTIAPGLHARLGAQDLMAVSAVASHRDALLGLLRHGCTLASAEAVCTCVLAELVSPQRPQVIDWRVRKAVDLLVASLEAPPPLARVAAAVGLSPTRLRHVFRAQVGLPMRRYLLWMRLRSALQHALEGASMTEAAFAAGFADAAHFTRTCHRMFGLPPTAFAPVDAVFAER